jgi:NAD-dependent deacetylase
MAPFDRALELLRPKQRLLAFTGAGISTESGIPDFRGPDGVWTRVDPSEFTFDKYLRRTETRIQSWEMRKQSGVLDAAPNAAHHALVDLWEAGILLGVVTQNIDGLHQTAGLPAEAVVELHGNVRTVDCLECGASWPTPEVIARVDAGEADPHCPECGGIIKVSVISFGQAMPAWEVHRASELACASDAVVAIGSTLSVYPAAYVPLEAKQTGSAYVIVNQGPTEQDHLADVVVEGAAGEILPKMVKGLKAGG